VQLRQLATPAPQRDERPSHDKGEYGWNYRDRSEDKTVVYQCAKALLLEAALGRCAFTFRNII
jgi:hypothetical protein